ncbi:MAG: hypothetical protein HOP19_09860 [Acidobacteria bacterium]|nr:hypothetical protein [Acidobacteriota bacterium]
MSVESLLVLLLFSAICGVIGQVISGRWQRGSIGATLLIGFIGALFGTWMAAFVGLPSLVVMRIGIFTFSVIWSLLGAAMLMGVVGLFYRRPYYAY